MTTSVPNGVGAGKVRTGAGGISLLGDPPTMLAEVASRSIKFEEGEDSVT